MKKIKLYFGCSLLSVCLIFMITSCSSDKDEPSQESVKEQITKESLEGGWTSMIQDSQEYGILRGEDGKVPNSKKEWKSMYKVSANYFIICDNGSNNSNAYIQYFDGLCAHGPYALYFTNLIYNGKAIIAPQAPTQQMHANVQNLEIMSYQYKKSANLLTSVTLMAPALSRTQVTFDNQLESQKVVECKLVPNIQGKSFLYETWEEDANGNILNYIDHGAIGNGGDTFDSFLVFTDVVYVRATDYSNKNAVYGHFTITDKSRFYRNLIWD